MFNEIHNYILSKNFEILNTPVIYKNKKAWQDNLI